MDAEPADAAAQPSALEDNLHRKGKNAYYYAHGRKGFDASMEWDGNEAPRLLAKGGVSVAPTMAGSGTGEEGYQSKHHSVAARERAETEATGVDGGGGGDDGTAAAASAASAATVVAATPAVPERKQIEKYAWCDEPKKVRHCGG